MMKQHPTELDATDRATMTITEAAAYLGIARGSAYQAARAGQLPVVRLGRRILVSRSALEQRLRSSPPSP